MPKFTTVVGIRLTQEEVEKLDWLCVSTGHPRPVVMRDLIRMAKVSDMPDMLIDPLNPIAYVPAEAAAKEVCV